MVCIAQCSAAILTNKLGHLPEAFNKQEQPGRLI